MPYAVTNETKCINVNTVYMSQDMIVSLPALTRGAVPDAKVY
jgi:hypothetical protein